MQESIEGDESVIGIRRGLVPSPYAEKAGLTGAGSGRLITPQSAAPDASTAERLTTYIGMIAASSVAGTPVVDEAVAFLEYCDQAPLDMSLTDGFKGVFFTTIINSERKKKK